MEPRLGADLSSARVHTGPESAKAAAQLGARAFTVGQDVHFGEGEFAPSSKEGDRLLAHELTHVVQGQKSGIQRKDKPAQESSEPGKEEVSHPDEPAEKEADAVANTVAEDLHGRGGGGDKEHDSRSEADEARANASPSQQAPAVGRRISRMPKPISAPQPSLGRKIFRATVPPTTHDAKKAGPAPTPPGTTTDIKEACHKKGGAAAQIVAQLEHEVQIDAGTKKKLFTAAAALFAAKGGDPLDAIQATLKSDAESYLCRGRDITLEAVRQEGGINRVVDLPSVFKYYLQDDIKDARFQSNQDRFLDGAATGKFDPYSHMKEEALLQGWAPLTWWSAGPPLPGGADMGKIMKTIHVDNPSYKDGGVRLDVSPDDFAKAMKEHGLKIYKPTAFDGAFQVSGDGKSALFNQDKDGSQIWGITKGGAKEAVMKPVPIKVFKRRTLLAPPRPKATADAAPKPATPPQKGKKA